jgi:hypothetical protein
MRKLIFGDQNYSIDSLLDSFAVKPVMSSVVEFIGDNGNDIFIQFKSGKSYLYKNISAVHIKEMYATESIGRFISVLSKSYTYVPIEKSLVKPAEPIAIATHDGDVNATIVTPAE